MVIIDCSGDLNCTVGLGAAIVQRPVWIEENSYHFKEFGSTKNENHKEILSGGEVQPLLHLVYKIRFQYACIPHNL
jgi:hypothetical protein